MPLPRRVLPVPEPTVRDGLAAIRRELELPTAFPPEVRRAASQLQVGAVPRTDRRDLPLVTIDPPGATDLDQAVAIEARDGGHVVWYAIADVAAFVQPGDPIDVEARARGVTCYAPDGRVPLHPPELAEGAASLLPTLDRPAVLWRLQLDPDGALVDTTVGRALVRSREQLTYEEAQSRIEAGDPLLAPLRTVGRRRLALEAGRGGVSLPLPDQEVVHGDGGFRLRYRAPLPVERWNAQLSLLCGMAAAQEMLAGAWGLLRTLPPADEDALGVLHRRADALGVVWQPGERYPEVIARIDPSVPAAAAFLVQSTRLFRGAGYLPLRPGSLAPDDVVVHAAIAAPYAHVTAPLRRLGDRFATEIVLALVAGHEPPAWVDEALDALPGQLAAGASRAAALDRAVLDHLEALVLSGHLGERFTAVVVDHSRHGSVLQVQDPAVVGWIDGEYVLGEPLVVTVEAADPVARTVRFSVDAASLG